MKRLLSLFLLLPFFGIAQTVTIPDQGFSAVIFGSNANNNVAKDSNGNSIAIDANGDGQIQMSEAQAVWELDMTAINIQWNIHSFEGINSFVNLRRLTARMGYSNIGPAAVDLTQLSNLENLIFEGYIYSINVSGLTNLKTFACWGGEVLSSVNLTGTTNLEEIHFRETLVTTLDISNHNNLKEVYCFDNSQLIEINLQGSTNIEHLECYGNKLSELNLQNLPHLKSLRCENNKLTTLNTENLLQIESINCSSNNLTSLTVSNLPTLKNLNCGWNQLTQLSVVNNSNLETLGFHQNQLTSVQLENLPSLWFLTASHNLLTEFDVHDFTKLYRLGIENNPITSLDFSNCPEFQNLYAFNTNLTFLNLKNNVSSTVAINMSQNNIGPLYICIDEGDVETSSFPQLQELKTLNLIQRSTYCEFTPEGNHNTIAGTVKYDSNSNGCDTDDVIITANIAITATTDSGTVNLNALGNYSFYTGSGNFTVTPQLDTNLFIITPPLASVNFDDINDDTITQDFCIAPNGIYADVDIAMEIIDVDWDTNNLTYKITYKNKGNQIPSGTISFNYNAAVLEFVSSSAVGITTESGIVSWEYTGLLPFERREETLTLHADDLFINPNQLVTYTAAITPSDTDQTPSDNTFTFSTTLLGEKEIIAKDKLVIYPNPTKGIVNIKAGTTIKSVELLDIQGRVLQTGTVNGVSTTVDVSGKQSGIYFIRIKTDKGISVEKIIKQ